jgi:hypothetical protein
MAKVNGANITATSRIIGKDATSISGIMGVQTANIPGWPQSGPSCTILRLGYTEGPPPTSACLSPQEFYDYDSESSVLYLEGACGVTLAPNGFYSDGILIYNWDGYKFTMIGRCGR